MKQGVVAARLYQLDGGVYLAVGANGDIVRPDAGQSTGRRLDPH